MGRANVWLGCLLLLVHVPLVHAREPAYLGEWPSAEQVLADHQGEDRQDTLARQMAALHQLDRAIEEMADTRRWNGLTTDETRLRGEYYAAAERIRSEVNSTLSNKLPPGFNGPFAKPPLRKWYALQWKYERDPQVRDQTLGRYLSPPVRAELGAKKSAADARVGKVGREPGPGHDPSGRSSGNSYLVPLAALAAVATAIVLFRRRRRRAASLEATSHATAAREAESMPSRETAPHPDVVKAAEEVLDSLEPYLDIARGDRERIPLGVFTSPYVLNFVLEYCKAAFVEISGATEASKDDGLRVLEQLSKNPRLAALVGGGEPAPSLPLADEQRSATVGGATAHIVLKTFAGGMVSRNNDDSNPQPTVNAPATRLHPAGPHARNGEQCMLSFFVEKLTQLISEST